MYLFSLFANWKLWFIFIFSRHYFLLIIILGDLNNFQYANLLATECLFIQGSLALCSLNHSLHGCELWWFQNFRFKCSISYDHHLLFSPDASFVKSEIQVAQSCPTLCHPMDCSPPCSSVHGIIQARILEWTAISFSRIFPSQVLISGLLHCRQTLYCLNHQGILLLWITS